MYACIGELATLKYCSNDNKILLSLLNNTYFIQFPTRGKSFCCFTNNCNGAEMRKVNEFRIILLIIIIDNLFSSV